MLHVNTTIPTENRATGIELHFGYPKESSVRIGYKNFSCFKTRGWVEGYREKSLCLTFNDQCPVAEVVLELKRAADALGIKFGDDPVLKVKFPESPPPGHNWKSLSDSSAKALGWRLDYPPVQPTVESPWTYD